MVRVTFEQFLISVHFFTQITREKVPGVDSASFALGLELALLKFVTPSEALCGIQRAFELIPDD